MRAYREITTQEEMDGLLARVAGFHDAMAKEFHIMNRGWVGSDHSMMMGHRLDARLLVQSQWAPFAIELLFIGIEQMEVTDPGEFWDASGSVVQKDIPVEERRVSISFDSYLQITAQRMFVLDRTDWLGPQSRFGTEVPHPDCVTAVPIDDGWRQCSACADAFEAPIEIVFVLCPSCGTLTEVDFTISTPTDSADSPKD